MRPTRYRRHSTTFKLELVRAYLNGEGGYKTIARKHDISHALLKIRVSAVRFCPWPPFQRSHLQNRCTCLSLLK